MKLQDIFDQLATGEFSQMSIGGSAAGVIEESNWPRVINHINLGLIDLYKRFNLKEGRIKLLLQPGVTTYAIKSAYAVHNRGSRESVRYLEDSEAQPFKDDIQKIEKVLTDSGFELGLNDSSDPYSVFTPSAFVLRVPEIIVDGSVDIPDQLNTGNLMLVYRASHPRIVQGVGYFDPARVEIELPDSHLEALLFYIASRANNPVGMTNEFHAGNSYYAKYLASCQALKDVNLHVDQGSQNTRLQRNGWV